VITLAKTKKETEFMPKAACSDQEFISLFSQFGGAQTAKRLGIADRNVQQRRRRLEDKYDRPIHPPTRTPTDHHPDRQTMTVKDGVVLVGSDAHYWPDIISTAHRAFVMACGMLKPQIVVMNGDAFDGASISRHAAIGWEDNPSVEEELNACTERLGEIEAAAKGASLVWTLGNHDARFESRLATMAPEFAGVSGMHLKDSFPNWIPCWSLWVNDEVVIKHRWKGGVHATHNNAAGAGKTMVTGHLHSLKVTPYSDYNGTRYGVDTGTMAHPWGPQFRGYMEDNPRNWRSGFAALTFVDGRLMWPEVFHVIDEGMVEFRGQIYEV
jgi:hypothetical protein